jgi:hypothetical protein
VIDVAFAYALVLVIHEIRLAWHAWRARRGRRADHSALK